MKKNILYVLFLTILILLTPIITYIIINLSVSQVYAVQENVVYTLPYPGILPDNPLYILKIIRDRITEFATRDYIKKSELYLLNSDKRVVMAQALVKKGKNKLAIDTFMKGEKYFFQIPKLIITSKKQGVSPSSEFVETLKLSNARHHEIGETLIKDLPLGFTEEVMLILKLNESIRSEIEKL